MKRKKTKTRLVCTISCSFDHHLLADHFHKKCSFRVWEKGSNSLVHLPLIDMRGLCCFYTNNRHSMLKRVGKTYTAKPCLLAASIWFYQGLYFWIPYSCRSMVRPIEVWSVLRYRQMVHRNILLYHSNWVERGEWKKEVKEEDEEEKKSRWRRCTKSGRGRRVAGRWAAVVEKKLARSQSSPRDP